MLDVKSEKVSDIGQDYIFPLPSDNFTEVEASIKLPNELIQEASKEGSVTVANIVLKKVLNFFSRNE